jgi:hypothetical protein
LDDAATHVTERLSSSFSRSLSKRGLLASAFRWTASDRITTINY